MSDKILVVDDDPVNNEMLQTGLEKKGYIVSTAKDGEIGLKKVQEDSPDLVILDIEMPNMNGYNFIHELRKMEQYKGTPVIVLTSHDDMQPIFEMKAVKDYMLKPVRLDVLYEKVDQILNLEEKGEQKSA